MGFNKDTGDYLFLKDTCYLAGGEIFKIEEDTRGNISKGSYYVKGRRLSNSSYEPYANPSITQKNVHYLTVVLDEEHLYAFLDKMSKKIAILKRALEYNQSFLLEKDKKIDKIIV